MSMVTFLTFNAFQENTYIISDADKKAAIIDPGCHSPDEKDALKKHIADHDFIIEAVLNTHCHVDHVFGNHFAIQHYGTKLYMHQGELPVLQTYPQVAAMYGLPAEESPPPDEYLDHGDVFTLGTLKLKVLLTPGHSPASISFYNEDGGYIIGGDVLFENSIGRTDLPGGNHSVLLQSIKEHFLTLPDETIVYPGHGDKTTIGRERRSNPFLQSL